MDPEQPATPTGQPATATTATTAGSAAKAAITATTEQSSTGPGTRGCAIEQSENSNVHEEVGC